MSSADQHSLEHHARRILVLQAALAVLLVLLILAHGLYAGVPQATENAVAGVYGALLGMAGTLIAGRSAARSARAALKAPQHAMVPVYVGLLNRLLVVGGGIAVGMAALGLGPVYIAAGYLVSQSAFVWAAARRAGSGNE